jgi:hypothetical protein
VAQRKTRQKREPDILTASAGEVRSIVETLGLQPGARSPLRAALSEAEQSAAPPASGELKTWKSHRKALEVLCEPLRFARMTMPGARSRTQRTFFASNAGDDFAGFWRENGGWHFIPAVSPDDILAIADEALGLHGTEDVAQTAHEWTATGLFALAAAIDAIRLRYLGEWVYRQLPSGHPFSMQDLNDQLRLGLENADPRWSVAMLAAVLPAGTFSIATDLAAGLAELAGTDGLVEYADEQKTQWIPGEQLQELAAEWLAPISALLLESVVLDSAGVPVARDSCALVRGQGPLILLDFGNAVRGEPAAKVAMSKAEPERCYRRLHSALVSPVSVRIDMGDPAYVQTSSRSVSEASDARMGKTVERKASEQKVAGTAMSNAPKAEIREAIAPTIATPTARGRYCTQCGTALRMEAAFCTNCGMAARSP